jgi:hypothetical protein
LAACAVAWAFTSALWAGLAAGFAVTFAAWAEGFTFLAGAAVLAFTAGFFLAVVFTIFFFFAAGLWDLAFALGFDLVMAFLRLATYRWRKRRLTP